MGKRPSAVLIIKKSLMTIIIKLAWRRLMKGPASAQSASSLEGFLEIKGINRDRFHPSNNRKPGDCPEKRKNECSPYIDMGKRIKGHPVVKSCCIITKYICSESMSLFMYCPSYNKANKAKKNELEIYITKIHNFSLILL